MIHWIEAAKQTPAQWAAEQNMYNNPWKIEGIFKVKLVDGREINSTWKAGQWSVERLKPNLKVAFWERPKIIA